MASIKDVAERAGVGKATVSRVINNNGYVAEDTRKKIVRAMEELHYTPNELARNLFRKRTGIVAVLVPSISHPYFGTFIDCIEGELYKRGFKTMICCAQSSSEEEKEYLDMLNRHIVDGVISGVHSADVEYYQTINGPIVAIDRYLGENIPVLAVDHREGGELAARELIANGCKNVVHFRGTEEIEAPFHDRHTRFEEVMAENGVNTYTFGTSLNESTLFNAGEIIEKLIADGVEFDGIFGVDIDAAGALRIAQKHGMRIPEDVKVVAYDGTYITELTSPQMTSIVQPVRQIAKDAAHHIANMIDGRIYVDRSINRKCTLRKGETTL